MKRRDYEARGFPVPWNNEDPNYDDGFYFPTDYHIPTPDEDGYWGDDGTEDDDGEPDDTDECYGAKCHDYEDHPENCYHCADDECRMNRS